MTLKTIGLIGGMSWESTVPYYRLINQTIRERLGGYHSAKILLDSVDFAEIEAMQAADDWQRAGDMLALAGRVLEAGGADLLILCTNTMHKVAPAIEAAIDIPFIHIADPTAAALSAAGVTRAGLLGTRFTMEQSFYRDRLASRGIDAAIPDAASREIVHRVIYDELVHGVVSPSSREAYRAIIDGLVRAGAQAVILGCTEIGLLVDAEDSPVPLFDTTVLHARAAAEWALDA